MILYYAKREDTKFYLEYYPTSVKNKRKSTPILKGLILIFQNNNHSYLWVVV